jgi:PAS domain S-box-containing protein
MRSTDRPDDPGVVPARHSVSGLVGGAAGVVTLLLASSLLTFHNTRRLHADTRQVIRTHEVIVGLANVLSLVKDAETGQRGYLITGEPGYLKPYTDAAAALGPQVDAVERLTADDPVQQARFPELRARVAAKLAELDETVALRRADFDAARRVVMSDRGRREMAALRGVVGEMTGHEQNLRERRLAESDRTYRWAMGSGVLSGVLALTAVGVFLLTLRRHLAARIAAAVVAAELGERLRTTLASLGDAVVTTDPAGRVTGLNRVAETLTGWTAAEAVGRPLGEVFRAVDETTRRPVESPVAEALRHGVVVGLANHTVLITKDGGERPIDHSAAPIRCTLGEVVGCVLVFRDITARRRLERENAERVQSARLLAAIVESSDDAIISKTLDGTIRSWNAAAERLFGYTAEQAVGRPITMLIPADRLDEEDRILAQVQAGKPVEPFDTVRRRADGRTVPVAVRVSPIRDDAGRIVGASKIARDISERIRTQDRLRASEEREAFVRTSSGVGFWYCDLPFDVLEWDELVKGHFWLPPDARVTIDTFYARIHPDDREPTRRAIAKSIEDRTQYDTEYRTVNPDTGAVRWVRAIGRTFYAADGTPTRFDGVTLDVTARKAAEGALRASEGRYRTLVEQVREHAIFGIDTAGRAETWNEGVLRVLGFEEDEFLGVDIASTIFTPEDVANGVAQKELDDAAEHGSASDDRWMRKKDGTRFWAAGITTARRDDAGRLVGYTKVMRDMTAQKRMQDELRQLAADLSEADRRKTEFLAMLAHELRNPLAPIRNAVQTLRLTAGGEPTVATASALMERQVGQMVRLVDDLLDVSRVSRGKIELRLGRVELASVVHHAVEATRSLYRSMNHDLTVSLPADPIHLHADAARLTQVVGNLLNNACKFTDTGGRVRLAVVREGGEAVIRVTDTGVGLAEGQLSRIFDLFAQVDTSLERSTSGLGIGLTLVKTLVEMHGGTVAVRSEGLGLGSEFEVRLPIPAVEPAPAPPPAGETAPTPARRILVADDNRDSAESLAMLLELTGHETRTAHDGLAAVAAAEAFRPDVLLCDIGMPKLNGYEVACRIRDQPWGRGMVLVALTGWGQEEDRRKSQEAGFDAHLVKPVDHAALAKLLAERPGGPRP